MSYQPEHLTHFRTLATLRPPRVGVAIAWLVTVGIAAAARYLSDSQYKGKVALTGLGTPNQMRDYVKNGTVKSFAEAARQSGLTF